jgi:Flp pilus assembly protein TadD
MLFGVFALAACAQTQQQPTVSPALTVNARLDVAAAAVAAGDKATAVNLLAAAAQAAPQRADVQQRYVRALADAGQVEHAASVLDAARTAIPNDPRLGYEAARLKLLAGDSAGALALLDALLKTSPRDPAALSARGVALDLNGDHAAAQDSYRQALQVAPNSAAARNNLAISLLLQGHSDQSRALLEQAATVDNAPPRVAHNLAFVESGGNDESVMTSVAPAKMPKAAAATPTLPLNGGEGRAEAIHTKPFRSGDTLPRASGKPLDPPL